VVLNDFSFRSKKYYLLQKFCKWINWGAVKPARAQVLITVPIENLIIKGTFHLDRIIFLETLETDLVRWR
jgi:hypothetical protein